MSLDLCVPAWKRCAYDRFTLLVHGCVCLSHCLFHIFTYSHITYLSTSLLVCLWTYESIYHHLSILLVNYWALANWQMMGWVRPPILMAVTTIYMWGWSYPRVGVIIFFMSSPCIAVGVLRCSAGYGCAPVTLWWHMWIFGELRHNHIKPNSTHHLCFTRHFWTSLGLQCLAIAGHPS